jgi:hypothetical protein
MTLTNDNLPNDNLPNENLPKKLRDALLVAPEPAWGMHYKHFIMVNNAFRVVSE